MLAVVGLGRRGERLGVRPGRRSSAEARLAIVRDAGKRGGCRRVRGEHGFDGVAGRRGGGAGGIGLVFRGCAAIEIEVERRARRRRKFARAGVGQIGIGRPNSRRAGVGLGPRVGRALAGRRRAAGWRFGRFGYRRGVVR